MKMVGLHMMLLLMLLLDKSLLLLLTKRSLLLLLVKSLLLLLKISHLVLDFKMLLTLLVMLGNQMLMLEGNLLLGMMS